MNLELHFDVPPMAVGRYYDADKVRQDLAFSLGEVERTRGAWMRVLSSFHFRAGERILITALFDELVQQLGAERAVMAYNMVAVNTDSSLYDARRVETVIRRFNLSGIIGLTKDTLDGLRGLGHDPVQLLQGIVVWARPGAYEELVGQPGLRIFRWFEVGPAIAMECAAGEGAHIDRYQWNLDSQDGEVVLSSRLERSVPFKHYKTGVRGRVLHATCKCGNPDPKILVD